MGLDRLDGETRDAVLARAGREDSIFAISALTGEGLDDLLVAVAEQLQGARHEAELVLAFSDGRRRAWLFEQEVVQNERQTEDGFEITVLWTARQEAKFNAL